MDPTLNQDIIDAHHAHYTDATPLGLIDPDQSPNGNIIYHLYSDGSVTYQKGGWAYLQRSEFDWKNDLDGYRTLGLQLPKTTRDETFTYAILTVEECDIFRDRMKKAICGKD